MANNNKYTGNTTTLPIKDTGWDNIIYQPSKPVLDSELSFMNDLSSSKLQDFIRSKIPSGWLDVNFVKGFDTASNLFGINTTLEPNTFYLNSKKSTPMLVNVNGWLLQIGGTNINQDNKVKIVLPEAPSSNARTDLVFLEVWKCLVESEGILNKPNLENIYKFGNTQYGGVNLEHNIVNPAINFVTTKRVQIQYRIRVVSGPDFSVTPEGIDDSNTVYAQGAKTTPNNSYTFTNAGIQFDDYGLYISGNGTDESREALGTVDGYVYAIPMFKIHRRNKGSFSLSNQNGSAVSVTSGSVSDRPDGLFNNQIHVQDIEDLRHLVSLGTLNYEELLETTLDSIYSGNYSQILIKNKLEGTLESSNKSLYINRISSSTQPNTSLITSPNGQQRYYSDVPSRVKSNTKVTTAQKITGTPGLNWANADQIQIRVLPVAPGRASGTITQTPVVKFAESTSGPISSVNGTWSNFGTSPVFTISSTPSLLNQDLFITFEIDYSQKGDKLTKPISKLLKVEYQTQNKIENWGFISVTDFDTNAQEFPNRVKREITFRQAVVGNPDFAYTYRVSSNKDLRFHGSENAGIANLYSYYINASGNPINFTIPGSLINNQDVAYVHRVYNTSTANYLDISQVQRNLNGSLSVTMTTGVNGLLRFDVSLLGGVVEYDQRTQSIVDLGSVDFYSIYGNNTPQVILKGTTLGVDPTDEIVGYQTERKPVGVVATCYINGFRTIISAEIEAGTSLISLNFPNVVTPNDRIDIALLTKKSLKDTESLNIFYEYDEYKGISSKVNFGNSASSFIKSKVIHYRNKLDIITNGTGALNSSKFLPKKYEPLVPKLPAPNNVDSGNFTGTIHKSKLIVGSSYTATSPYNTPYVCGYENFMSKQGINQDKGTNSGGRFIVASEDGEDSVHKIICGSLIEMVVEDGSRNFVPGELALKLETNYVEPSETDSEKNIITNSSNGDLKNSYDMFRIEGRPLIKLNSK